MTASVASWWDPVVLGRSGLRVSRLGLGSSYGVGANDIERAFERGINFLFFGLQRKAGFAEGIRRVCAKDRDRAVVALQSYSRAASLVGPSVEKALRALKLDRVELLVLGWWNGPPPPRIVDAALRLKASGKVRAIGVSCHHRPNFATLAQNPAFDVLMLRYNAAHVGAEGEVFPHIEDHPAGVLAFTATRWASLLKPELAPRGEGPLTATDCYRFCLSHPRVQTCLAGVADGAQLDAALLALDRGPLTPEEDARARRVGAAVRAATQRRVNPVINALDRLRGVRTRTGA